MSPMCIKKIFLDSTNIGDNIKLTNLHISLLNFCSGKQKRNGEAKYLPVFNIFRHPEGYQ